MEVWQLEVFKFVDKLKTLFLDILNNELIDIVVSGKKGGETDKIKVRPVMIKGNLSFQVTRYIGTQVFHENGCGDVFAEKLADEVFHYFKQVQVRTKYSFVSALISKKGQVTIKQKQHKFDGQDMQQAGTSQVQNFIPEHNRKKSYLLEEGTPVPFLTDLGVMTAEGKVVHKRYDKYRQINRFLEFIEDVLPQLDRNRELTIIDFGCGKSYLTFAMYYYMKVLKGYDIHIIGLDLKADVIRHCNALAEKYGYEKLEFLHGDIADFEGVSNVDMVVTLHACDTATDYALYKAVLWKAKVILSVPCCQHELNGHISSESMQGMLKFGLIKERFAALATDSLRAMLMESVGYRTQILEFIDMEHTPKNILLRCVCKKDVHECRLNEDYVNLKTLINAKPKLEQLLMTMNNKKISY